MSEERTGLLEKREEGKRGMLTWSHRKRDKRPHSNSTDGSGPQPAAGNLEETEERGGFKGN